MKRIRYQKTKKENEIESVRCFFNQNGTPFRVKIDIEQKTYRILNFKEQRVVKSTEKDNCKPPKNLYTVYEQVKRALKKLGIEFTHEFRQLEEK